MLRVAAWTGGLFAIGAGVAHYFPGSWTEPAILAVLGATMLFASRRAPSSRVRAATPRPANVPEARREEPKASATPARASSGL